MTMSPPVGNCSAALVLCFMCFGFWYTVLGQKLNISDTQAIGEVGKDALVNCTVSPETATVEWKFQNKTITLGERINVTETIGVLSESDLDGNQKKIKTSSLHIDNVTSDDSGDYFCNVKLDDEVQTRAVLLNLTYKGKLLNVTESPIYLNISEHPNVTMSCIFEVYKPAEVKWYKVGNENQTSIDVKPKPLNPKQVVSTYLLTIQNADDDNGTYNCEMEDSVSSTKMIGTVDIIVYASPIVTVDKVIGVNTTQLYLNWTVKNYNLPIEEYQLSYAINKPKETFRYGEKRIGIDNTSFVLDGLNSSTEYRIKLQVRTRYGWSLPIDGVGKTLDKEPIFVPNISINGFSATSVTIGKAPPPNDIEPLIHYYELKARKKDVNNTVLSAVQQDNRNLPYMFDNLEPHSTYVFQVRACSDYTMKCGDWSEEMEAATLDGTPGKPHNVVAHCTSDLMNLTWGPPLKPNAEIKGYTMELTGHATFRDRTGAMSNATWGPLSKFTTNVSTSVRFTDLQPNTNYTVRISAMTRTRRRGEEQSASCWTDPAPPDVPPRPRWRKVLENDKYLFKVVLPRMSERNGPICCYRVYMVHLSPNMDMKDLEASPKDVKVLDYKQAHAQLSTAGAYITDIFSNNDFPSNSELVMGDGEHRFNKNDTILNQSECLRCLKKPKRGRPEPRLTTSTSTVSSVPSIEDFLDADEVETEDPPLHPLDLNRVRRHVDTRDYSKDLTMADRVVDEDRELKVEDGPLDGDSSYTLFVELITGLKHEDPLFSDYLNVLRPAPTPPIPVPSSTLEITLQVVCAIAALVLLAMIIFCVMQTTRTRKPPQAHLEMNRLPAAIRRYVESLRNRQPLSSAEPPTMPPLRRDELAEAYAQRQADSDYGFQKEFELLQMLPERYPDRTTHASEARENQPKNRYPDIKAYDQTRVKLSQIDSVTGSDYINANYVNGYQDRKRFICAQGPTDTTVNDFWRMIWEHGLELIVMLTNLEEHSKVKCSKYWPDEVRGARAFGNIVVQHVGERRYSDYIVRELKISKLPTNSEGQPIVENNGVAKRNGDCKDPSESSAPTSPREVKETSEARIVRQYHFLMWKDFAAPEHPHSILKFIKRVNEAWSNMVGRPAVVHCSAGVGRTGTLVALDCLLDQLRETDHAAVFNTVAELRRQRNFLVQSLKQYVFVYRALVEYAHYGDTEIPASRLKSTIDRLRNMPEGADKCLMEHEFEKILNSPVAEPLKSCAAGAGEELRPRNRSGECLPYDRNRVILTPIPGRDYSTYINASFIEAYDNSEGFIITQDPMPNTITDFWRMVSEHNVSTIVMLSEMGESKCPRYWDDGTVQYEHISVQYEKSESCPYYTRRQFAVVNDKSGDVSSVHQLQYQGWPTAPGHVPEVTRGLAELADAACPHTPGDAHAHSTMLVHCHYGTERSSLFVALCILICQLRAERRVDVCSTARKVRSQRARTIDTFLQYEFLHRAILNYAELHNLLEDS
ncbi:hypothetical protein K1T71_013332 [Dendrolimus kikuchii]|uniref:Uncharacterized protein n=1 Tax=Dendrolimus kikuchii TaxID=765133 RepID=A0ACC1CHX5_9NEOP|nr:hypothetical protein K1T71_013332 [Dendrolimus kikuchii]